MWNSMIQLTQQLLNLPLNFNIQSFEIVRKANFNTLKQCSSFSHHVGHNAKVSSLCPHHISITSLSGCYPHPPKPGFPFAHPSEFNLYSFSRAKPFGEDKRPPMSFGKANAKIRKYNTISFFPLLYKIAIRKDSLNTFFNDTHNFLKKK